MAMWLGSGSYATLMPTRVGVKPNQPKWCISAAIEKGAGAEDAHKLLVRHNVDFCATCCSRCFGPQKPAHP